MENNNFLTVWSENNPYFEHGAKIQILFNAAVLNL
jgi:hypothetical protein